jgi:hypothetical protein
MDLFIIGLISTAVFFVGMILCLEIVGFDRVSILAAMVAVTAGVVSVVSVQLVPKSWTVAVSEVSGAKHVVLETPSVLNVSRVANTISIVAAVVFCVAGTMRIWQHRSVILSRFHFNAELSSDLWNIYMATASALLAVALVCLELSGLISP